MSRILLAAGVVAALAALGGTIAQAQQKKGSGAVVQAQPKKGSLTVQLDIDVENRITELKIADVNDGGRQVAINPSNPSYHKGDHVTVTLVTLKSGADAKATALISASAKEDTHDKDKPPGQRKICATQQPIAEDVSHVKINFDISRSC